jgi:hypothetical protein
VLKAKGEGRKGDDGSAEEAGVLVETGDPASRCLVMLEETVVVLELAEGGVDGGRRQAPCPCRYPHLPQGHQGQGEFQRSPVHQGARKSPRPRSIDQPPPPSLPSRLERPTTRLRS